MGSSYMGFGPPAHSFNGAERRWNVSNTAQYIKCIHEHLLYHDHEQLSLKEKFNEYIMLQLRRIEGINIQIIKTEFPSFYETCLLKLNDQMNAQYLIQNRDSFKLSRTGKHLCDFLTMQLFA